MRNKTNKYNAFFFFQFLVNKKLGLDPKHSVITQLILDSYRHSTQIYFLTFTESKQSLDHLFYQLDHSKLYNKWFKVAICERFKGLSIYIFYFITQINLFMYKAKHNSHAQVLSHFTRISKNQHKLKTYSQFIN